jgi:hypothetical protein
VWQQPCFLCSVKNRFVEVQNTFFLLSAAAYFCQNLRHGATKEAKGFILADIPCVNRSFDFCYLFALGMVDPDTSFSNYCFCKGNEYNVMYLKLAKPSGQKDQSLPAKTVSVTY